MNENVESGVSFSFASVDVDHTTYNVGSKNYVPIKNEKTQIILASSLRKNSNYLLHLKKKEFGLTKAWPTFTIRRDGKIFNHFDPAYNSEFMKNKDIDQKAIVIVLENMGMLSYDYNKGKYVNWINEECDENHIYEKLWRGNRYWEMYTQEQLHACVRLCVILCRSYGIKQETIGNIVQNDNASKYEGILSRGNYSNEYFDLSPAFDFKRFVKELSVFS